MAKRDNGGNPAQHRAALERRRSSAAGLHQDRRTRRARNRQAREQRAIDDAKDTDRR